MADESDQQLSQGLLANAATDPLAEGEYLELEGRGGGGGTSEAEAHVHTQGSHPAAAEGPPRPPPAAPPDGDGVGYAGAAADAIAPAESGAGGAAGPARVDELSVNLDGGTDDDLSPGPAVAGRAASHGAARRWALWRTTTAPTTKVPRSASNKIKLLNLVGIIMVLYIHSYNQQPRVIQPDSVPRSNTDGSDSCGFVAGFQYFFAGGLLRCAVPFFFCTSGYLFFVHKADDLPLGKFHFFRRIKARVQSLLLPFVLWNMVSVLLILLFLEIPGTEDNWPWFAYVRDWNLLDCVYKPLWDGPVAFQLWYLRDLFLLVTFFSPIVFLLHRIHPAALGVAIAGAAVPWLLHVWPLEWSFGLSSQPDLYWLDMDGLVFFPLGAMLSLNNVDVAQPLPTYLAGSCAVLWVALSALHTSEACREASATELTLLYKAAIPFGMTTMWLGYDHVLQWYRGDAISELGRPEGPRWLVRRLDWLAGFSLWIYCAHAPMMGGVMEQFLHGVGAYPDSQLTFMLVYLFMPLLWTPLLILAALSVRRVFPSCYALLTGGRSKPRVRPKPARTAAPGAAGSEIRGDA